MPELLESTEPKWYVIHTYSGHENKVKINLENRAKAFDVEDQILEVFLPVQEKIEIRDGKKTEVTERIFPGYLLINMILNDKTWSVVQHTPAVTAFVGTTQRPKPISDTEVTAIKQFSDQKAPQYKAKFSVGEALKIIDGPFSDFIGTVDDIDDEKGKLHVLVSIFGRETPVELDFLQVSKL